MPTSHLRRITSPGRRFIPEVDGLRFVAVLAVVVYHLSEYTFQRHDTVVDAAWLPEVFRLGRYGVQLFFALSGFLLALPFAKWRLGLGARPSLSAYYLRRVTRLEPPYFVSMLLFFGAGLIAYGPLRGLARWPNLVASLAYQHNLVYHGMSAINGVAWSLEIEVQFYMLAPLLASIFSISSRIFRRSLLTAVMIGLPLLRGALLPRMQWLLLPWFFEFFVAGFLLADIYLVDWREQPVRSLNWDLVSFTAWPFLLYLLWEGTRQVWIAPVLLACISAAFRGAVSSSFLRLRPVTLIGGMCYSLYLLHSPSILAIQRPLGRHLAGWRFTTALAIESAVAVPAILAIAITFFVILERPCMDPGWPSKLLSHLRRHPEPRRVSVNQSPSSPEFAAERRP